MTGSDSADNSADNLKLAVIPAGVIISNMDANNPGITRGSYLFIHA